MTSQLTLFGLLTAILLSACSGSKNTANTNKFSDDEMVKIHELKDHRNTDELLVYLKSDEKNYVAEAALALCSVGDSMAVEALKSCFLAQANISIEEVSIQQNCALALFQSYRKMSEEDFLELQHAALTTEVESILMWTFGKHGAFNPGNVVLIIDTEHQDQHDKFYNLGIAKALYEWLGRKKWSAQTIEAALELAKAPHVDEVRIWSAAYLGRLTRMPNEEVSKVFTGESGKPAKELYELLTAETNPLVKLFLAQALGNFSDPQKTQLALSQLQSENDYRVTVALLDALGEKDFEACKQTAAAFIGNDNSHIEMAAASFLSKYAKPHDLAYLESLNEKAAFWRSKSILLGGMLRSSNPLEMHDFVFEALAKAPHPWARAEIFQALNPYHIYLDTLLKMYPFEAPVAKTYCLEAMAHMALEVAQTQAKTVANVRNILAKALRQNDAFEVYTAALQLQQAAFQISTIDNLNATIDSALMQWPLPQYFETNVELQKLKRVYEGGKAEEVHQELAFNNPIDWAYVKRLPKEQKLKIDTWKGSIIITLDVEGAPGTVAQIAKLAENGFYNDLIWHRVIRNFVVQGGDPLGNGTGSAKGTLRSEFNMDQYREGAVGIASAGKDTESCQFFITHNYTPHLNGRYTIIGYVTEGMDVVHQLQVNDPIVSVSLVEEN